ncbi:MAG: polynucleotide adenylyltransferase PcnB, partial [Pseudomonadota bacterium]
MSFVNKIKKIWKNFFGNNRETAHCHINLKISHDQIDKDALTILRRLARHGYQACLVGGAVRDLLLGRQPKDFDIATNARPRQIKRLFRNCRLIGRRFRLAHLYFKDKIIEVSTFRSTPKKQSDDHHCSDDGMILRDNVYGTIEEDAWRRDFTINALYYDITKSSIIDFCGGLDDLKANLIRTIGDPFLRCREDPVRILRVIRFAAKLNMTIEETAEKAVLQLSCLLKDVPPSRLFHEFMKFFSCGYALNAFKLLCKYNVLKEILPLTQKALDDHNQPVKHFIEKALKNTDERLTNNDTISAAFLFAFLLWHPLLDYKKKLERQENMKAVPAFHQACHDVLKQQIQHMVITKHLRFMIIETWSLQLQ